ncbi:putative ribonuclease H-like domain-containing protein [Medicago truncatula]|uniref:Putative ribonuclease H-like domain-containing protein n=1 Tax=Medicago truncatula TaxID=3880 RepID=A0A396I5T2_MEDTR|nr:putative ribonuclease H-like domain-containing protein [Medicago truncatula]
MFSSFRRFKEITPVVWKPPTVRWVKINTDGSVRNSLASCGGIFRDHRGTFLGCFACNFGPVLVFEVDLSAIIFAMEFAARFDWLNLWLESDSSSAVLAFKNSNLIPFRLRNRWHNCFQLGIIVVCSHLS